MDENLIGYWRVLATDMIADRAVTLIGGLPGECVEFTSNGLYRVGIEAPPPSEYHYRTSVSNSLGELDAWIKGLEPLTARCLYGVSDDELKICIAGDSKDRPTELRRDDEQLWCIMTLKHTEPTKPSKPRRERPLLKPSSFIPSGFLDPDTPLRQMTADEAREAEALD